MSRSRVSAPAPALRLRVLPAVTLLALLASCGGSRGYAPGSPGPVPDLSGASVMLVPVQLSRSETPGGGAGLRSTLDAEIDFWMRERAAGAAWSFPEELQQILDRSPSLDIRLRALAVSRLRDPRLDFIGDPLLGDLRRLGAVADRRLALIPVEAMLVPAPGDPAERVLRIRVALVDTVGGRVVWSGIVEGDPGEEGDPSLAASAARAFARSFLP